MTHKDIIEQILKMRVPTLHPLRNIIVAFDPFVPTDKIFVYKNYYHGKKLVFISKEHESTWEKMEEKEGVRAERVGERIYMTEPTPLPPISFIDDPAITLYNYIQI